MAVEVRKTAINGNATATGSHNNGTETSLPSSPTGTELMDLEQDISRLKVSIAALLCPCQIRTNDEQERLAKLKSLEASIFQEDAAYQSELAKKKRRLAELALGTVRDKDRLGKLQQALRQLEAARPSHVPYRCVPPCPKLNPVDSSCGWPWARSSCFYPTASVFSTRPAMNASRCLPPSPT